MTIGRVCYCTREMLMQAMDIKFTARSAAAVDRAIESAADNIDGYMHRVFFPTDDTRGFDYPNYTGAPAWRLYLNENELADVTANVPVVKSGGVVIPASSLLWYPLTQSPPYRWLELNRSTSLQSAFGQGNTPQNNILIQATFGFWIKKLVAGTLAASIGSTSATQATISDGSKVGVGDMLIVSGERMLVTDKAMASTGQSQQGAGVSTANRADVTLAVTDGTKFAYNETIALDSERMFIVDITGNNLTVIRGWDGTVLAPHTGATIYAARLLTITRGDFGTVAATHSQNDQCYTNMVPALIRDLSIAEASVQKELEVGGYAGTQGSGANATSTLGEGLSDKWEEAETRYARQMRIDVI